jgi:ABC-type histidine transport system ATPase subunit
MAATRGAQAADAAIVVGGLTKRYGPRTVVDGVSLEVRPGEVDAPKAARSGCSARIRGGRTDRSVPASG